MCVVMFTLLLRHSYRKMAESSWLPKGNKRVGARPAFLKLSATTGTVEVLVINS